ncbi:hypothetical protein [Terriglobus sp. RCC_193]|uniref:hypothetical protein n=1 Tax=Terriglobus sp. RCC_193 TaxID=3239218 RepID=UPI003523F4DC
MAMTNDAQDTQDERNTALVRALETSPQITAPQDFATRVMARVPQKPQPYQRFANAVFTAPDYGRKAIFAALVVLVVLMFALTPAAAGKPNTWTTIQLVLLLQLSVFVLWLGFSRRSSRQ